MTQHHVEILPETRSWKRFVWGVAAGLMAALVVIAVLSVALYGVSHANRASRQALAGCQLYKTVAEAPLSPQTTALGLNLAAGARVAYARADCQLGRLKPADPRVAVLLPPGVK